MMKVSSSDAIIQMNAKIEPAEPSKAVAAFPQSGSEGMEMPGLAPDMARLPAASLAGSA